ncbi:hypothetical protein X798_00150 [Onchocerca flexuosa]|uniref:VRR-NUC domain-containing protein n=2 Tax=Onchocerca flexuosa TaxID=387005 RepID=A0A183H5I9_9BILA|nr:hypothetical protein X798_00150 [Onchocerca flexuosa]VDO34078.1 unnamed protein product [Onchocerca flexuosa]
MVVEVKAMHECPTKQEILQDCVRRLCPSDLPFCYTRLHQNKPAQLIAMRRGTEAMLPRRGIQFFSTITENRCISCIPTKASQ